MDNLYNKEFKITVALATYTMDGGSSPKEILGTLTNIVDDFYKFENVKSIYNSLKGMSTKDMGDIYIKKDYIISMEEFK